MKRLSSILLAAAAVAYLVGGISLFMGAHMMGHDSVVWWRGAMGLIGFAIALSLTQPGATQGSAR